MPPKNNLAKELEDVFRKLGIEGQAKESIREDLSSAIFLSLFEKLYGGLGEEDKKEFLKGAPEDPEGMLKFMEKWVSKEKISRVLEESAKEITEEFAHKF